MGWIRPPTFRNWLSLGGYSLDVRSSIFYVAVRELYQKREPRIHYRNNKCGFDCARLPRIQDRIALGAIDMPNRRDFAKLVLAGGAGMLAPRGLWPAEAGVPAPPQNADDKFDLLIEGGTVIDPSQNLNGAFDVAIKDGKIL